MTMIMSSTIEQEEKIKSLSTYLSHHVFPRYIDSTMADVIKVEKFFHIEDETLAYVESLKDASRVITALNTIVSILETAHISSSYEELFTESVNTLRSYQIDFPFPLSFFHERKHAEFL
ncbi:hypothetical protein AWH48_15200 [Domibacillus aminovorans]|uniref:Uncharacterized protein n=1 Tax=Domibacillus aminovorans TaxID=29332 RepID=A0A177L3Z8_9BACI|nr:DUF5365 family protein [Domibacillus aminovorans]OAH59481.1 hypothetical protein AWH48_15200 [Domibacillus aminovorans]